MSRTRGKKKNDQPKERMPLRQKIRWALHAAWVTALALSVTWGGWAFYTFVRDCDYLRVKTIGVQGAKVLAEQDIVAASGITNADNILFIDVAAVRERVQALPYIRSCEVTRMFPDMVIIRVKERTAVATLVIHNRPHEIDGDCVVLRQLAPDSSQPGPFITEVPGLGIVEPGQTVDAESLARAIEVWDAFQTTSMAQDVTVSEIAAVSVNDIRMYCNELPFELRWGRRHFDRQARRLDILWRQKGRNLECSEYLDLRFDRDLASR